MTIGSGARRRPPRLGIAQAAEQIEKRGAAAEPAAKARIVLRPGEEEAMAALAKTWADENNRLPDSLSIEYGAQLYRDRVGKLRISSTVRGEGGKVQLKSLPSGSTPLASLHNHPYLSGLTLASKGRSATDRDKYMQDDLPRPSDEDWKHVDYYGPGYSLFVLGPDGVMRSFRH